MKWSQFWPEHCHFNGNGEMTGTHWINDGGYFLSPICIPMLPHQLKRLAKLATIGIGRSGSPGGNDSSDIFLTFSLANEMSIHQKEVPMLTMRFTNDQQFDPIYD